MLCVIIISHSFHRLQCVESHQMIAAAFPLFVSVSSSDAGCSFEVYMSQIKSGSFRQIISRLHFIGRYDTLDFTTNI